MSALVPYKRVDVAIEACRMARVPLTVVGHGPEAERLQQLAGPDCTFAGWRSDEEVRELYRSATALVLPGVEDFGIVPVEAQACGRPVVALAAGGACETVVDGETGILVRDPSAEAFADGLARVQQIRFDAGAIRASALRFSRERFLTTFRAAVAAALGTARSGDDGNPAAREDAASDEPSQNRLSASSRSRNPAAREDEQ